MIETENSKLLQKSTQKFLFPSLTEVSSMNEDNKRSHLISCPSIDSFSLRQNPWQQPGNNFMIQKEISNINIDEEKLNSNQLRVLNIPPSSLPSLSETTIKPALKADYEQIKDVLLEISSKTYQTHNCVNSSIKNNVTNTASKLDAINEWCAYAMAKQKVNRKYLKNKLNNVIEASNKTTNATQGSITSGNTSITPLEVVSSALSNNNKSTPVNNTKITITLPRITPGNDEEKDNEPTDTTEGGDSNVENNHESNEWRLHMLNYKHAKGCLSTRDIKNLIKITTCSNNKSNEKTIINNQANTKIITNKHEINPLIDNNSSVIISNTSTSTNQKQHKHHPTKTSTLTNEKLDEIVENIENNLSITNNAVKLYHRGNKNRDQSPLSPEIARFYIELKSYKSVMKSSNQTPIKPNVPKKYHTKVDVLKFIYENDNQEAEEEEEEDAPRPPPAPRNPTPTTTNTTSMSNYSTNTIRSNNTLSKFLTTTQPPNISNYISSRYSSPFISNNKSMQETNSKNIVDCLDRLLPEIKNSDRKSNKKMVQIKLPGKNSENFSPGIKTPSSLKSDHSINKNLNRPKVSACSNASSNSNNGMLRLGNKIYNEIEYYGNDFYYNPFNMSNQTSNKLNVTANSINDRIKRVTFLANYDDQSSRLLDKFNLSRYNNSGEHRSKKHTSQLASTPIVPPHHTTSQSQMNNKFKSMHDLRIMKNDKTNLFKMYQRLNESSQENLVGLK